MTIHGGADSQTGVQDQICGTSTVNLLSHLPTIDSTPTNSTKFQAMGELLLSILEKYMIEEVQCI